jgi:hypothetical protein
MIELLLALMIGAFVSGPFIWENLPTCDMRKPIERKCREVRGQWGGTVDGAIHAAEPHSAPE